MVVRAASESSPPLTDPDSAEGELGDGDRVDGVAAAAAAAADVADSPRSPVAFSNAVINEATLQGGES